MQRFVLHFSIALESVMVNKLRGLLTALGIVFGVAAVITMLAIGSGAKKYILDQMKLIGTNNIIFEHKTTDANGDTEEGNEGDTRSSGQSGSQLKPWAPGVSTSDLVAIRSTVPTVETLSPEIITKTKVIYGGRLLDTRCVGVTRDFFELNQLMVGKGSLFSQRHVEGRKPVCVIGKAIESKLFSGQDPIGKLIKCGSNHFTVIGVLDRRIATRETLNALGLRDYNLDIFIPLEVSLMRFGNRARIEKDDVAQNRRSWDETDKLHQIDRLVVRVYDTKYLQATANIIGRLLKRRHQGHVDFTVEIPELLLKQEQKTQDVFNLVLAVIAGISLLVGGIGIMNIMLASVYERIKEIGLRRSMGATQKDIVWQFLIEAMLVSVIGGVIGIFLGIAAAHMISSAAEIPTVVSGWSLALSFGVAAAVGLLFGIFPARKAAHQDPITALRSE